MLLKLDNMVIYYGKAIAIDGVSMEIAEGEVVSLVGANGAGKTTILRAISGLIPLTRGEIWYKDRKINGISPSDIVQLGLVHIPQGRKLFPYISVLNNLKLGASLRKDRDGMNRDKDMVF